MAKQIKLTKGWRTVVDDDDYDELSKHKWHYCNGYAQRYTGGRLHRKTLLMHRVITNAPAGYEVDHINRDRLDNRRCNLRICTRGQNQMNKNTRRDNTSGYRGVVYHKRTKRWRANINAGGAGVHLGYFDSSADAARAYNAAALRFHGEFARLNVIEADAPRDRR